MDTQDGFIVGIYNYCDRWCERCALASRCRVFAERQREELGEPEDPGMGTLALRSLGAVAAAITEDLPDDALAAESLAGVSSDPADWPTLTAEEYALHARARALGLRLWDGHSSIARADTPEMREALEVVQHFAIFVGPKVYRALMGRHDDEWRAADSDAHGSAKAALLGLDRLGDAWLRLAEQGAVGLVEAAPVLSEIQELTSGLEQFFPRARAFVRPGLDEPDAVAMLEWRERG